MKNIILQHWTEMTPDEKDGLSADELKTYEECCELAKKSSANIYAYANRIGCDYKLIQGDAFRPNLKTKHPPVQKLIILDEQFDDYDMVVMLDSDMFTRKGMNQNIFTDVDGAGWHGPVQDGLVRHMKTITKDANPSCSYWGGSIYRFDKNLRMSLREHLPKVDINKFCNRKWHGDEGIMHVLASRAGIKDRYLTNLYWNYPSFEKNMENACIIHIRTKVTPNGHKAPKIKNYNNLVKRGVIEG